MKEEGFRPLCMKDAGLGERDEAGGGSGRGGGGQEVVSTMVMKGEGVVRPIGDWLEAVEPRLAKNGVDTI